MAVQEIDDARKILDEMKKILDEESDSKILAEQILTALDRGDYDEARELCHAEIEDRDPYPVDPWKVI